MLHGYNALCVFCFDLTVSDCALSQGKCVYCPFSQTSFKQPLKMSSPGPSCIQRVDNFIHWIGHYPVDKICARFS